MRMCADCGNWSFECKILGRRSVGGELLAYPDCWYPPWVLKVWNEEEITLI
jgi:hypothetical protein